MEELDSIKRQWSDAGRVERYKMEETAPTHFERGKDNNKERNLEDSKR